MPQLEIGNKPLNEITPDELRHIVVLEGCCCSLEFWGVPEIIDYDNTMFSDSVVLDYFSYRKSDMVKSSDFVFFFNFKDFRCHYTKDFEADPKQETNGRRVGLETIKYLIKQGYDVPIY